MHNVNGGPMFFFLSGYSIVSELLTFIQMNYQLHNSLHFLMCLVAQSCQTLYNPTDYSLPGSSIHGILQARILEWVAMPFSRGSSQLSLPH